jgi:hypothetical protein
MTLRNGSSDDVRRMFDQMNQERKRILSAIVQLVYFMRGSVQYKDMFEMTLVERETVSEFIEKRLEVEAKKMYPTY